MSAASEYKILLLFTMTVLLSCKHFLLLVE